MLTSFADNIAAKKRSQKCFWVMHNSLVLRFYAITLSIMSQSGLHTIET